MGQQGRPHLRLYSTDTGEPLKESNIESGEVLQASSGGVTFTGILTDLCGNGYIHDETSFTIKEASE